jgi:hypothetical protein
MSAPPVATELAPPGGSVWGPWLVTKVSIVAADNGPLATRAGTSRSERKRRGSKGLIGKTS